MTTLRNAREHLRKRGILPPNTLAQCNTITNQNIGLEARQTQPLKEILAFKVYPNPSTGIFTIELPNDEFYTLQITDIQGKTVSLQYQQQGKVSTDLSGYPSGLYIISAKGETNTFTAKLIHQ
jgi:Secretion system C-terminal sorting domain